MKWVLGLKKEPPKPEGKYKIERPKNLFAPPPIRPEKLGRRLPKSFTNRPGVKKAQVNLKKAGYDPNAKIEEEQPRRRRQ